MHTSHETHQINKPPEKSYTQRNECPNSESTTLNGLLPLLLPPRHLQVLPILPIILPIRLLPPPPLAPAHAIHLTPHHREHVFITLPPHPAIQMSVAAHHLPAIPLRPERIPEDPVRLLRCFGGEDLVVGAGEEEDGDALQAAEVGGRGEGREEGAVAGYGAAVALLH